MGAHSSRCGQRGRKQLDLALLPPSHVTHIGRIDPACLENPLPFFPHQRNHSAQLHLVTFASFGSKVSPMRCSGQITTSDWDAFPSKVRAGTHGNTLVLLGEVTQPYKKAEITYGVAHIKGVAAVDDRTQVLPLSPFDDDLRMRIARAIYDDPYFSEYVDAGRLPIHIVVHEEGVTLEGVVDSQIDRARAEEDAEIVTKIETVTNNLRVAAAGR